MNNYFCVLPFYAAEFNLTKNTAPCCLLPKDVDIKKVRQEMLVGKRPNECSKCWAVESMGKLSDRQIQNTAFDFYSDTNLGKIEENCRAGNYSTQIIKLYTSNLCNSTCATCNPVFSSKWQSIEGLPIRKKTISTDIISNIDFMQAKMITFVGGEPLYEKKNLDILETVASVNKDCFISIVTNGSIKLTAKQKNTLSKLKNLNICLSIDGIDKQFEYIRYPLKWDVLQNNIIEYRNIGAKLSVSFTISNLNILYYDKIVSWFKEQNLPFNHNIVNFPQYFNIEVLPVEIKKNLPLIKNKDTFDLKLWEQFVNEIKRQDKLKKINIENYIPELSEIIDNFRKN